MKTVGFWCLSLGISWCFLTACQDEWNGANDARSDMQTAEWDGVVYPSSKYYHPMTKGMESFETDWETFGHVTYPGEEKITTPWSQDVTNASLPYDFAYDVKKEDGWKMLFHTFTEGQGSRRYIGLYNQRTGMLKVFYYLKDSQLNNTGVWQLNLGANQEYLNHTGEFAIPINVANVDGWGCTNATIVETKAFERGWNGFQVQLAYTPNISTPYKLAINTYASNVGDLDLFGENYAYSEGTIITYEGTRPKDNLGNSNFVSVSGKSAEEFINDEIAAHRLKAQDGETRGVLGDIAAQILKYGANKIFSKLTASLSQPSTTLSDLEFSTKGIMEVNGTFSLKTSSSVESAGLFFDKDHIGEIGTWNLAEQPIIYMDPRGDYMPDTGGYGGGEHRYRLRGISRYEYDLLINPELESHILDKWVEMDLVRYWEGSGVEAVDLPDIPDYYSFGSLGGTSHGFGGDGNRTDEEDLIYGTHQTPGAMYAEEMDDYMVLARGAEASDGTPYQTIFIPNMDTYENKHFNSSNLFLKMSLYTVTEFEGKRDTTISTRTFIPKIEWDPVLCDALKDIPMEDLHLYDHIK